jgi:putative ABC transport system ATP-binding protein
MEPNLFKYIWKHSWREQLFIVAIVIVSQIPYYLSLDLPKQIVNEPIQGQGFEAPGDVARFLVVHIPVPDFLRFLAPDGMLHLFDGFELTRIPYLIALSMTFLVLVLINGGFKLQINTMKGRMGERMLRRLRFELFDRVLRFPLPQFRRVKQAEIATMIKDEVEPLGGFIGDAFVAPAFLGGQALTALVFILGQSFYLGAATVFILLIQFAVIPILRRPVLRLGRERQLTARQLAGRIAEIVDGVVPVHVHDTSNYERSDIAHRLGQIFWIRFRLYKLKFVVKFLNNLLAQLTPFFFYLVGGYLAITGHLDVGGLVAVIGAYKDLPGPVKELIDWYQQLQDVGIKYEAVIEQFQPDSLLPPERHDPTVDASAPLEGSVTISNLTLLEDGVHKLLDGVSFEFPLNDHVALAGEGREALALALAGLLPSNGGSVRIGGRDLATLPEAILGRRLSYVGPEAYLFPVSVRDNLLYGLKHRPLQHRDFDEAARRRYEAEAFEARRAGNPDFDPEADWIDYAAAGATGPDDINERLLEVLKLVELDEDVYQLGLRGTIDPNQRPELTADIIKARQALRGRLDDTALAALVEPFDRHRYNRNMTVAENILFGTPVGETFRLSRMSDDAYVQSTLDEAGLTDALLSMGRQIAETMVELFADLPSGHPFFEQFSFIDSDDLPEFRALLARIEKSGLARLSASDRAKLIALSLPYAEARHRLGLIDETLEERLLVARSTFAENLPPALAGAVEFYDEARYNAAATLQDNILFGRLVYGQAQATERIGRLIAEVLDSLDLRQAAIEVGLDFQVGIAGKRLSAAQRQKVDLARAVVKRPDLLILNEATTFLDLTAQPRIMNALLAARQGKGVVCTLHRASLARNFDLVVVMRAGRIVERGTAADLARPGTALHELMAAE